MIQFTCSCGKKYQLPDRNAGREVRCNQCEKTLIVPKLSQTEPVVPEGSPVEPIDKPENAEPAVESEVDNPFIDPAAEPAPSKPVVAPAPEPVVEPEEREFPAPVLEIQGIPPSEVGAEKTTDITAEVASTAFPQPSVRRSFAVFYLGILAVLLVGLLLVGAVVGGFIIGFSVARASATMEQDEIPPISNDNPTYAHSDFEFLMFSATGWNIKEETLPFFEVRTADGVPANLSLDGDPTPTKTDKQSTLDVIAAALGDDLSKGAVSHEVSLRIESSSGEELCVVWPKSRNAGLEETEIKELRFCVYIPLEVNAVHKPGKPELADFRLRIGDAFGDIEFVLSEKERTVLCERSRTTWYAVSVPIDGDERWLRTERGRLMPKTVDFIEFRAKPIGEGITFWVDNLSIVGP